MSFFDECRNAGVKRGIVLGSGLGEFVDGLTIKAELSYGETEEMPNSTVPGHAGRFLLAEVAGERWLVMQGRVHLYEGHTAHAATAGIRLMHEAGVEHTILTNAAGTLNRDMPPGSWMMISDHLNLTGQTPLLGGPNFIDMTTAYDLAERKAYRAKARELGMTLGEGVYAGLLGPQYETPAEIRMLRALGADAVGMSTVLETIQARALGMRVSAFSCLTNWAAGMGDTELDHSEVTEVGQTAAGELVKLLKC